MQDAWARTLIPNATPEALNDLRPWYDYRTDVSCDATTTDTSGTKVMDMSFKKLSQNVSTIDALKIEERDEQTMKTRTSLLSDNPSKKTKLTEQIIALRTKVETKIRKDQHIADNVKVEDVQFEQAIGNKTVVDIVKWLHDVTPAPTPVAGTPGTIPSAAPAASVTTTVSTDTTQTGVL